MECYQPHPNPTCFGIIGYAEIAQKVSRAIRLAPNAELIVVTSRSANEARRFIIENGLSIKSVAAYGSYEEVLEDSRVDAVYVPLPTSLHVWWATAKAGKGRHVLLDKPTTLCVSDLDRILEVCAANGVQFMDSTMWMHHPPMEQRKRIL